MARLLTLYINRAQDDLRRSHMEKVLADVPDLDLVRVEAVDGSANDEMDVPSLLPEGAGFGGKSRITAVYGRMRAAVFLSHMHCWAQLLASDADRALILEDDVDVFPGITHQALGFDMEGGIDLAFVNERMDRMVNNMMGAGAGWLVSVERLHQYGLDNLTPEQFEKPKVSGKGLMVAAFGGDGYVLSRRGAQKLLDGVSGLPSFPHVDHYLYIMGITPEVIDRAAHCPRTIRMARVKMPLQYEPIHAVIARPAHVRHVASHVGGTVRGAPTGDGEDPDADDPDTEDDVLPAVQSA